MTIYSKLKAILYFGGETLLALLMVSAVLFAIGFVLNWISSKIRAGGCEKLGPNAFNLLFAPGIVMHEISHALAAILFLHEVREIKFFDLKAKDGNHGHVIYRARNLAGIFKLFHFIIQLGDLFIGIAPLIIGPALSILLLNYAVPGGSFFLHHPSLHSLPLLTWQLGLWAYFSLAVVCQMELSPADLSGTWKGFGWVMVWTFVFSVGYYQFHPGPLHHPVAWAMSRIPGF